MKKIAFFAALLATAAMAVPASAASFLFVRHAESAANAGTASSIAEYIDPPLTALGQQQAVALSNVLASYDIIEIFTSAYQRTQQTIAPTAALFGITPTADARTNEWYMGDTDNLADYNDANLYGVILAWAAGDTGAKLNLPNAESLDEMAARVIPAWEDIINAYKDQDGVVVIVGHGAETGMVMPYFAENISHDFAFTHFMTNTGIIEVELINGQPYVTNWQGMSVAVPEAETWMMMIAGFGAIGIALRRKRAPASRSALIA